MDKGSKNKSFKTLICVLSLSFNIGFLLFYKYLNFFIDSINWSIGASLNIHLESLSLLIPIGLSYITFQQISYIVDIYIGKEKPLTNIIDFSLYILFFPKIIAGPIVKFSHIRPQIIKREHSFDNITQGMYRFSLGLGKKVLIANSLETVANKAFETSPEVLGMSLAWLGMITYTLQIYYDFSGYSDMAIGLGNLLGFSFEENFNKPYISKSISEFWRRWHISLSSFFRDYVYIPLGGSHISKKVTYFNTFLIFFLSGFWHGANYTFIVWGIYHGLLVIIEKAGMKKTFSFLPGIVRQAITFILVSLGWVIFRADNLNYGLKYIKAIFSFGESSIDYASLNIDIRFLIIFIFALVLSLIKYIHPISFESRYSIVKILKIIFSLLLLLLSISIITTSSFMPFIYFKF